MRWPDGKAFAFTIFDDTDDMTLENGPPVYELLHDLGFRTTKSVWTIDNGGPNKGLSCADEDYLRWVQTLQAWGFEIASHGTASSTATRAQTQQGMEDFKRYFGAYPSAHANHSYAKDGVHWGDARMTGINRAVFNVLTRFSGRGFEGHVPGSELFWGDLCKDRVRYVRNFVFGDIDTLAACPDMPYRDERRPFVDRWFASSEGATATSFVETISEANQDRLEAEGGACIMYAHLAVGFTKDGQLHPEFERLMTRLSRKNGWFVPVTTLLDHLASQQSGNGWISDRERRRLERRWLTYMVRKRLG